MIVPTQIMLQLDEKQLECQGLHDEIQQLKNQLFQLQANSVPSTRGYYGAAPIPVVEVGTKRQRVEAMAPELAARVTNSAGAKTRNIKKEQWTAVFATLGLGIPPSDKTEAATMLLERLVD